MYAEGKAYCQFAKRNEMKQNKMTTKPLEHHTSQISVCDTLNEQKTTGSAEFLKFKYIEVYFAKRALGRDLKCLSDICFNFLT